MMWVLIGFGLALPSIYIAGWAVAAFGMNSDDEHW